MKNKLSILLFLIVALGLLSRCGCYSCIADGDSLDLPYSSNQTVNFANDSHVIKSFLVQTSGRRPQSEYCGRVGSESYGICYGEANALLKPISDDDIFITINCRAGGVSGDDVERHVAKNIEVEGSKFNLFMGNATTSDEYATVTLSPSIKINGTTFSNVYIYQNDSAEINNCSYFVYSLKQGIIKFTIKLNNSSENWILTK